MLIVPGAGTGGLGATCGGVGNIGVTVTRAWDPWEQVLSSKACPPPALSSWQRAMLTLFHSRMPSSSARPEPQSLLLGQNRGRRMRQE